MKRKKTIGLLVLLGFFMAAGGWYVWQSREEPEQLQSVFQTVTPEPTENASGKEAHGEKEVGADELPQMFYVFVCGAVVNPGVYAVPEGSRLVEALEAAGGFLPEADSDYHNLARVLADGERVYILSKEETAQLSVQEQVSGEQVQDAEKSTDTKDKRININTATVAELTSLPGIGEARAESIVEYRSKVGGFRELEEIMNISGIGEAMFEKIKDRITIE